MNKDPRQLRATRPAEEEAIEAFARMDFMGLAKERGWTLGGSLHGLLDLSVRTERGCTLLHLAAGQGEAEAVELLLPGSEVDARDLRGNTPLIEAAIGGCERCVALLIAAGADRAAKTSDGYDALSYASMFGRAECARALIDGKPREPAADGSTHLMLASSNAGRSALECVRMLLPFSDMDARDIAGMTALDRAKLNPESGVAALLMACAKAASERAEFEAAIPLRHELADVRRMGRRAAL